MTYSYPESTTAPTKPVLASSPAATDADAEVPNHVNNSTAKANHVADGHPVENGFEAEPTEGDEAVNGELEVRTDSIHTTLMRDHNGLGFSIAGGKGAAPYKPGSDVRFEHFGINQMGK